MTRVVIKQAIHFFAQRPLKFWLMLLGIFIALLSFEEVVDDVFHDPKEGDFEAETLDRLIRNFVSGFQSTRLTQVMTDLTALGSVSVVFTLFIIFISILISFRDYKGVGFLSLLLTGAGLWPYLLKLYFARERPDEVDWLVRVSDLSFPSGHAFGAAATYIGFAYYAGLYAKSRNQKVLFYFLGGLVTLLVGVSRVYLGVHYPTDVMAGLSGGIAWGLIASLSYDLLNVHQKLK